MRIRALTRLGLRDLRGGFGGLRIFLACIAIGVAAIVGVNSLARALEDGLAREGRKLVGGDASFSVIHQELSAEQRAWLAARGRLDDIASMRAMAVNARRRRDAGRRQGRRPGLAAARQRRIRAACGARGGAGRRRRRASAPRSTTSCSTGWR